MDKEIPVVYIFVQRLKRLVKLVALLLAGLAGLAGWPAEDLRTAEDLTSSMTLTDTGLRPFKMLKIAETPTCEVERQRTGT